MTKQIFTVFTAFVILNFTFSTHAQVPVKIPRIGFLSITTNPMPQVSAFRQGLRELGYVEGKNLVIIYRSAEGRPKRLPALAAELVALKVDLIVTYATPGVRAAKQATSTIPIVIGAIGDVDKRGFVKSLARPGGNATGLSFFGEALSRKRLGLLRELLPNVSRLAVLYHATHPEATVSTVDATARSMGLQVQLYPVSDSKTYQQAFVAMAEQRANSLSVLGSPILSASANRKTIIDLAARYQLPAVYGRRDFVVDGGLMSYAPSFARLFHRAATFVDKILKGANPATLPVERATRFELAVNLRTAKALGITIPNSILLRATKVIE